MIVEIKHLNSINGNITVPGDKSISHRALILGAISLGENIIKSLSTSKDVKTTEDVLKSLGISIEGKENITTIKGIGLNGFEKLTGKTYKLYCGNSGTTARLMMGLLAGAGIQAEFTGDRSLSKRPMDRIVNPLKAIGVKISDTNGHLPVKIDGGKPVPFHHTLQVASAQVKSALMLSALFINGTSTIIEPEETRDHTERMLLLMDGDIKIKHLLNGKNIIINGRKELTPLKLKIPGDISSAIFFIAAALTLPDSELKIEHVLLNPTRSHVIDILKRMGANISVEIKEDFPEPVGNITVKSSKLKGTTISGFEIPLVIDEIPALAAIAFFARGETVIKGAKELRVKESDRIKSIVHMIRAFGGKIEELEDGFIIKGKNKPKSCIVDSFGDHRIAMASSIIAFNTRGGAKIKGAESVEISYPSFFKDIERVKN